MIADLSRKYPICDASETDYATGTTPDGMQVLMGLLCPNIVAPFFDLDGGFLRRECRRVLCEAPWVAPEFEVESNRAIAEWQASIGFATGTIAILRFFDEGEYLGIRDRPEFYDEYLADPAAYPLDDEGKQSLAESISHWDKDQCFVLHWGKDYWLNRNGEIDST